MKWLDFDTSRQPHAAELLSHVRFETIPAGELVSQIQPVPRMMMDPQCHRLLVDAMNYHLLPFQQNTLQSRRTQVRGAQQTLLTIGGRPSLTERALSREVSSLHHQQTKGNTFLADLCPLRYCGGTLVKEEPRGATSPSCQRRASTSAWLSWTASSTCLEERTRTMPVTRPSMPSAP